MFHFASLAARVDSSQRPVGCLKARGQPRLKKPGQAVRDLRSIQNARIQDVMTAIGTGPDAEQPCAIIGVE